MRKTKKEFYGEILGYVKENVELVEFINKEIDALNKKNSKKGVSKTQKENIEIKDIFVKALTELAEKVTVTEFQAKVEKANEYSNQKVSALLNQLYKAGEIEKTIEKGKSYFYVNSESLDAE